MMNAMKYLIAIVSLSLLAALSTFAQNPGGCPTVEVIAPEGLTIMGDEVIFRAKLSGSDKPPDMSYKWIVSAGKITEGQGTGRITVIIEEDSGVQDQLIELIATVTAKGPDGTCVSTATEIANVIPNIGCMMPIDEYGASPWEDEQARLDNLFIQLRNSPNAHAYIEMAVPANETIEKTKKHIIKMVKHFRYRGPELDLGRLRFAVTKAEEGRRTRFLLIPDTATDPECSEGCTLINAKHLYF